MAKKTLKSSSPFLGRWQIVSMSTWDNDYLNEEVQAYIEFNDKGGGSFQFGYIQGMLDWRTTNREGKPGLEFSWEGGDGADGTPLTGRGWVMLRENGLNGMIFIHQGDDSEFEAEGPKPKGKD
jgi:hypothetical protein